MNWIKIPGKFPNTGSGACKMEKLRNSLNLNSSRQEAVTQYDEKKFEPDPPEVEQKEVALLQKRSLHSQSTSGSTETVVEASPVGKKGQSNKKRPDNLDVAVGAVTAGIQITSSPKTSTKITSIKISLTLLWLFQVVSLYSDAVNVVCQGVGAGSTAAPASFPTTWPLRGRGESTVPRMEASTTTSTTAPGRKTTEHPALTWLQLARGELSWKLRVLLFLIVNILFITDFPVPATLRICWR